MGRVRRIVFAILVFAVWFFSIALGAATASETKVLERSPDSGAAQKSLWRTFPGGGGYFQQRSDGPVIVIPTPPSLPAPGAFEGARAGQHGKISQERVVPSFIPDEAMETGAFSGGL
ncbi:hypothetical protein MAMC_00758 [Methylacidimicrobium cyclopophantes]|uniref:Uncharacterized protein n=1 Tax=Methylacidimicrobium cyclopophantes TaxID=1041766 RepID=A0A5E6MJP9_9BACT|nr:hypothetical protein MAMC_00758 [Methylacidimicrobium cyclopophantes]